MAARAETPPGAGSDAPAPLAAFGAALELRLAALREQGVAIGPGERAEVWRLTEALLAQGALKRPEDLEPYLRAVLARSPEQATLFDEAARPSVSTAPTARRTEPTPPSARRKVWAGLFVASILGLLIYAAQQEPPGEIDCDETPGAPGCVEASDTPSPVLPPPIQPQRPPPRIEIAEPETGTPAAATVRILDAARALDGADAPGPDSPPLAAGGVTTLGALAAALPFEDVTAPDARGRAIALSRLSGAPLDAPLDLRVSVDAQPRWAAPLARALDLIERPESAAPLAAYAAALEAVFVDAELSPPGSGDRTPLLESPLMESPLMELPRLGLIVRPSPPLAADPPGTALRADVVASRGPARAAGLIPGDRLTAEAPPQDEASEDETDDTPAARTLAPTLAQEIAAALADPEAHRATRNGDSWRTPLGAPEEPANVGPLLTRALATALPVLLALLILWRRYRAERRYLRRRRPRRSPTRTDLVTETAREAEVWSDRDRRLAQMLQTRETRETGGIDIERSIRATLARGGLMVTLEPRRTRPAPDYLVLVEQRGPSDQTAARLRNLLARYRRDRLIHMDVYTYQSDPSLVAPLDETGATGGYRPLETLRGRYPDHRLIILGAGRGIIGAGAADPSPALETLRLWERRALLTPIPLSEWSRAEFALAAALDAPVGRATREGFLRLGALLGLDEQDVAAEPDAAGDLALTALPGPMRRRPRRLLSDAEPEDYAADAVIADLQRLLDRDGFRWLCALAVYPALQWDLTLYLGVELGCYRDDAQGDRRLSALSRLPWLQAGRLPRWLREALIRAQNPADAAEVYRLLIDALRSAAAPDTGRQTRQLSLRIGDDRSPDLAFDPRRPKPFDDEVMVDFLRRGDVGDLPLPDDWTSPALEHRRRFFARDDLWRIALTGAVAAAAIWALAPPPEAPAVTGGWLPVVPIAVAALLAILVEAALWRRARDATPAADLPSARAAA